MDVITAMKSATINCQLFARFHLSHFYPNNLCKPKVGRLNGLWHFSTRRCEDNEASNDRLTNLIIGNPVAFLNKSIATDRIYHSTSSSERGWYADFEYEYEYYLLTNTFRRGKQLWDDITHHLLGTAMSCGLSTFLTPRQENTVRENHAD